MSRLPNILKSAIFVLLATSLISCSSILIPQPPNPVGMSARKDSLAANQEYASNLRSAYVEIQESLFVKRGLTDDFVFVAGLGAASSAVYRSSRDVIAGLALLTGASDLYKTRVSADEQVKIYGRAIDSLQCLIATTDGVRFLENQKSTGATASRLNERPDPAVLAIVVSQQKGLMNRANADMKAHLAAASEITRASAARTAQTAKEFNQKAGALLQTFKNVQRPTSSGVTGIADGRPSPGSNRKDESTEQSDPQGQSTVSEAASANVSIEKATQSLATAQVAAASIINSSVSLASDDSSHQLYLADKVAQSAAAANSIVAEAEALIAQSGDEPSNEEICDAADNASGILHDAIVSTKATVLEKILDKTKGESASSIRNTLADDVVDAVAKAKALKKKPAPMSPQLVAAIVEAPAPAAVQTPQCDTATASSNERKASIISYKTDIEQCLFK